MKGADRARLNRRCRMPGALVGRRRGRVAVGRPSVMVGVRGGRFGAAFQGTGHGRGWSARKGEHNGEQRGTLHGVIAV